MSGDSMNDLAKLGWGIPRPFPKILASCARRSTVRVFSAPSAVDAVSDLDCAPSMIRSE
jgi:hypothetical protein